MSEGHSINTISDFGLIFVVAIAWMLMWLVTRRPDTPPSETPKRRWLRFSLQGLFWLVLIAAFLIRERQREDQKLHDFETITRLQHELDIQKLRADKSEQFLRDRVQFLERQLKNATATAPGSVPSPKP